MLRLGEHVFEDDALLIMAIVNRTPDSFYDKCATFAFERALERVHEVVRDGAEIVDIGGVKAAPGVEVTVEEEIERTVPFVAAGNRRAREAGLSNLYFREGDASKLDGIGDDRFDLVVSIFGAMFAPRPFDVAREMVRVTKPGGRIVMGNWIPGDPTLVAQILKISAAYTPPPPEGFVSPVTWGVESNVRERFGAAGIAPDAIDCEPALYDFRFPYPPVALLEAFRSYYGPTMNAFEAAAKDGREQQLHDELLALFETQNRGGEGETIIPARYLKVIVTKR